MRQTHTLVDDDSKLEVIRLSHEGCSSRTISMHLGIPKTTITDFLARRTHKDFWRYYQEKPVASGVVESPEKRRKRFSGKRYVFTSAQNNSYVFREFIESIKVYLDENDADLVVGTFTYNKTGFQNLNKESEGVWYDPYIASFINNESTQIFDGLVWSGELNILPTAVNPLSGLHNYSMNDSSIIPHAKLQLESCPRHKGDDPKFLYTTGCCTKRNYIDQKAGQKASFHHVYSALVAEVDEDGDWFVRQLVADDNGHFQDLGRVYTPTGSYEESIEAINYGDIHAEKIDSEAAQASFGDQNNSMLDTLKPKYQLVHDLSDFTYRNHHNRDDPYFRFKQWKKGEESVETSMTQSAAVLSLMERDFSQVVVVDSNHHNALVNWLKSEDYRKDPVNSVYFLWLQYNQYKAMEEGVEGFSIYEFALKDKLEEMNSQPERFRFLGTDETMYICGDNGIYVSYHGHLGINGSRGSPLQFTKLNSRVNTGHTHTCMIRDGVYVAGTLSRLDMGYNKGPSGWSHSNIITFKTGKRQIVTIKNGKYKA